MECGSPSWVQNAIFSPILRVNLHLPVVTYKVHGAEPLGFDQGVEGVINEWEGVGILMCLELTLQ